MSDCCSNKSSCDSQKEKKSFPRKFACPKNNKDYIAVSHKTIIHQLKTPWKKELTEEQYYFCDDPECDVVYFGFVLHRISNIWALKGCCRLIWPASVGASFPSIIIFTRLISETFNINELTTE